MVLRRQNSREKQNAVCLSRPSGPEAPCVSFQVLCSTSTLALGVNLPAHLVVVKSTRRWSADDTEVAGYKEYDTATCLQMIGRCAARATMHPCAQMAGAAVSMVVLSRKPMIVQTMSPVCRHGSKHISLRCRAGRPQFDTEGVAVIMTDVKARPSRILPCIRSDPHKGHALPCREIPC